MNVEKLVTFLESHGAQVICWDAETITIMSVYTTKHGGTDSRPETIPATRQACRDWLGY